MEIINNKTDIDKIEDNKVIGNLDLNNASIEFKGTNNILYCTNTINLQNCKIRFTGSNSIVFFDSNNYPFSINIRVGNDSVFYLGKNSYLNRTSNMYATERKNIIIGNECLLSFNCYFRTADPHIIYDTNTRKRINFSKSILLGDHVWIGQDCLILKGTKIGSGAIIGGKSVVSNKRIESNSLYAGNPVRKIKKDVCYASPKSTHDFREEDEIDSEYSDSLIYKYEDNNSIDMSTIDRDLMNINDCNKKLVYIKDNLVNNAIKDRFYIG